MYTIDQRVYHSEINAKDKKEAISKALAMFGDCVDTVMETHKPIMECTLDECKIFWVKGMASDIVTDKLGYNKQMIRDVVLSSCEAVKRCLKQARDEDITIAMKVVINTPHTNESLHLMDMVNDKKLHDIVKGVFCAGIIYNHTGFMDRELALAMANGSPESLREHFDECINNFYTGPSYKNMKKAYKKYDKQILTFFGFGMHASSLVENKGLNDKARARLEKKHSQMVDEINKDPLK